MFGKTIVPALLLLSVACGDSSGPQLQPAAFQFVAGIAQIDTVGRELKDLIAVRVVATDGATSLPNVPITWTALDGGQVFATVVYSGSDGIARQRYTLGTQAGTQRVRLTALDGETGAVLVDDTVTAEAVPGMAAGFAVLGPDTVRIQIDSEADSIDVRIEYAMRDQYGNRTTICSDGGSADRVTWGTSDIFIGRALGTTSVESDRQYTDVRFYRYGDIYLIGHAAGCVTASDSLLLYPRR